jgi:hypothetical protein
MYYNIDNTIEPRIKVAGFVAANIGAPRTYGARARLNF